MKIQAVIFDLDGTLLNTLEDIAESANRVLQRAGLPVHPVDSYRYFVGEGLQRLIERIIPEDDRNNEKVQTLVADFRLDYSNNWKVKTGPYKGIDTLLDGLVAQGLKLAVFSNKPHEFTLVCVRDFFADWPFEAVLGQQEGRARKPDPAGAFIIAEQLGMKPSEILYLGDTATDMKTAGAAGMVPVGALWGFRTEKELQESGAAFIVKNPLQVLDLLKSLQ